MSKEKYVGDLLIHRDLDDFYERITVAAITCDRLPARGDRRGIPHRLAHGAHHRCAAAQSGGYGAAGLHHP
jgi:hypothetical protein